MEGLRHQIEASLGRSRDLMMEDRYRRMRFDGTANRLKKPLNLFSRKNAVPFGRDKYGSVSALSTSAIYGELRPPASYAMFGSTGLRHPSSSVRSPNRSRATVYPWETFIHIGEPIYEDVQLQEAPPHHHHHHQQTGTLRLVEPPLLVTVPCTCQKPHRGSLRTFKCPACSSARSPRRKSILPERNVHQLYSSSEQRSTPIGGGPPRTRRANASSSNNKLSRNIEKNGAFSSLASRKSILECDVSAYDMIKKHLRESGDLDSDLDDNLSDNEVNNNHHNIAQRTMASTNGTSGAIATGKDTVGRRNGMRRTVVEKSPPALLVALPEPDYDQEEETATESDTSYDATRFKDLRISYSPPPARKLLLGVNYGITGKRADLWPDSTITTPATVPRSSGGGRSPDLLRPILKRSQAQQELRKKSVTFRSRPDDSLILEQIDNTPYPDEWEAMTTTQPSQKQQQQEKESQPSSTPIEEGKQQPVTESKNAGTSPAAEPKRCDTVTRGKPRPDDGVETSIRPKSQSQQGFITCTFATPDQRSASLHDLTCITGVKAQDDHQPSDENKATVYISFPTAKLLSGCSQTQKDQISPKGEEELYEDTRQEHIYEELPDPVTKPPDDSTTTTNNNNNTNETPKKSFFEGASKAEILNYLEDAKERVDVDDVDILEEIEEEDEEEEAQESKEAVRNKRNRISNISNSSSESGEQSSQDEGAMDSFKSRSSAEIERNDSGVGAETSKPQRRSTASPRKGDEVCADCDQQLEATEGTFCPLVCKKCEKKCSERKDIVTEIVDTELKYGRDLRIVREEFYRPMEVAGLLGKEQLHAIFLNLEELIKVNLEFSEKLQDAIEIAAEQGDEDYTTVNIGKLFLESSTMLHTFETYCVRQSFASVHLHNLEKEKELLRIFLRVSQMENTLMRRMNLSAFLMVPVQRVTKYPLLLSRLYKVTPYHHQDREALRDAQQKIEIHLEHINQQTKGVGGTKIWRRISNISTSHRRQNHLEDIGSIKLRKMAMEWLKWSRDEVRFVMAGKMLCAHSTDFPWSKKGKALKFLPVHTLLVTLGKPNGNYRPENSTENLLLFPKNTGIRDATLLLIKEKNGRLFQFQSPLHLASCVISCESEDVFEVHEFNTKEAFLFKSDDGKETKEWLRQLRYHAKDLGHWRRRRNALANIMINGMVRH